MNPIFAIFIVCVALFCPFNAQCASQNWQPGFRTNGLWLPKESIRLDYNIWYPAKRQPGKHNFPPWIVRGSLNAPPVQGSFPLLVLSHPSPANRFFFSELAAWLAAKGFIVAVPTHGRDNLHNMEDLRTWDQLKNRVSEVNAIIAAVADEPAFKDSLDKSKTGYIGFGAGAAAGLLLGGCLPECPSGQTLQNMLKLEPPSNRGLAQEKIASACVNFPLKKSLANPKIKAMALIAPDCAYFFDKNSFNYFYPPVLLIATGNDLKQENEAQAEQLGRALGNKALFLNLPDTDPAGLQDVCPQSLAQELPELCLSIDAANREKIRNDLEKNLYGFFQQFLIQHSANIPDPPDLSPPPEKENVETPKKQRKKRNR